MEKQVGSPFRYGLSIDHDSGRARIEELTLQFSCAKSTGGDTDKIAKEAAGVSTFLHEPAPEWAADQQQQWVRAIIEETHKTFERTGDIVDLANSWCFARSLGPLIGDPVPSWILKELDRRFLRVRKAAEQHTDRDRTDAIARALGFRTSKRGRPSSNNRSRGPKYRGLGADVLWIAVEWAEAGKQFNETALVIEAAERHNKEHPDDRISTATVWRDWLDMKKNSPGFILKHGSPWVCLDGTGRLKKSGIS